MSCRGKEPARDTCTACNRSGKIIVTGCPMQGITTEVWEAIAAIDLVDEGIWPITGGSLEQSDSFLEALAFYRGATANLLKP